MSKNTLLSELINYISADSSGKIGIGTSSPQAKLEVATGNFYTTTGNIVVANGNQTANTTSAGINLGNRGYFGDPNVGAASIQAISTGANWYSGTAMAFFTNPGPDVTATGYAERMRITSGGNVLVGNTSDNGIGKLQVNGSVNSFGGSLSSVNGSAQYLFTFDNSRPRMGFLTAQTTNGSGAYYYTGIISNRGGSNTADTLFGNAIAITFSGNNVYITTTNSANINTWTWSFLYID